MKHSVFLFESLMNDWENHLEKQVILFQINSIVIDLFYFNKIEK